MVRVVMNCGLGKMGKGRGSMSLQVCTRALISVMYCGIYWHYPCRWMIFGISKREIFSLTPLPKLPWCLQTWFAPGS